MISGLKMRREIMLLSQKIVDLGLNPPNWQDHELGSPDGWPDSLKALFSTMLLASTPAYICWGPKRILLFNAAYQPLLNTRGLNAFGKEFNHVWPELISEFSNFFDTVETGQTLIFRNHYLKLLRKGFEEDTYFDFSIGPVCDSDGYIQGVQCFCTESTDRVVAEKNALQAQEETQKERDQLRLHQQWLAATLRGIGDAVIATDADREPKVTYLNPVAEKLTGWSSKEAEGMPVAEVFKIVNESTRLAALDPVKRVIESKREANLENHTVLISRNGNEFVIEDSAAPIKRTDDSLQGVVLVFRDSTKRHQIERERDSALKDLLKRESQLRESQTNLNLALKSSKMGTWHYDFRTDVVTASPSAIDLFGGTLSRNIRKVISRQLHPDDRDTVQKLWDEAIDRRGHFFAEYRIIRPDGSELWAFSEGTTQFDTEGKAVAMSGIVADINDRVLARMELEKAKLEADQANLSKSLFLANMSHEIRTPLGAIIGFAELLKEHNIPASDKALFLDTIVRNGNSLTRIIDDILDLSKVEMGKLEIEKNEFSFLELIRDVKDLFREGTRVKKIYLRTSIDDDVPDRIISDATRIRQLLVNIIGNAVKFTHEGGVDVLISRTKIDSVSSKINIRVNDSGIGMSEDERSRIFRPFVQADNSTTRKFGGTGLGLVISKRFAEALEGTIAIENTHSGRGTSFVISFTVQEHIPPATQMPKTQSSAPQTDSFLTGYRVLAADDSPDNRVLIRRILQKYGAEVEIAENGLEAYQAVLDRDFDFILMDIQMPKMDGYEATAALRKAGITKPIIALTAHAMAEERARSLAAGCNGHLTKPINRSEFITLIQGIIREFCLRPQMKASPSNHLDRSSSRIESSNL
jgi:PAS domain S-box-containing protein